MYLELANTPAPYSINFERQIRQGKAFIYVFRIGASVTRDALAIPIGIHAYTAPGDHHFEWSLVAMPKIHHFHTLFKADGLTDTYLYAISGLGYRYQQPSAKWFLRASLNPMLEMDPPSTNIFDVDPKLIWGVSAAVGVRIY